eukprot:227897-Lingulodinium_polyedra.AAC.1
MSLVAANSAKLILLHDSAKIELAMIQQLSGDAAIERGVQHMLHCVPIAAKELLPEIVAQRLQALRTSKAHKLAPRPVQEMLRHIASLVAALVDGRPPDVTSALASERLRPIISRFQFFVKLKTEGSNE